MTTNTLPKTQAATLAYLKMIDDTGAPAYEYGSKVPAGTVNLNAIQALWAKGLVRHVEIETGTGENCREVGVVVLTDRGYEMA